MVRLIHFIAAIDEDFVIRVTYAAANLDDGDVVPDNNVKTQKRGNSVQIPTT